MAITEQTRHDLYEHFVDTMGEERAMAMMEHLPMGGAATLASKDDLGALKKDLEKEIEILRLTMATKEDLANLRAELHSAIRTHTVAIVTANAAIGAIILTAARAG